MSLSARREYSALIGRSVSRHAGQSDPLRGGTAGPAAAPIAAVMLVLKKCKRNGNSLTVVLLLPLCNKISRIIVPFFNSL
jgi:hypothetical protein